MIGFGHQLSEAEQLLVSAFDHNGELVMPYNALKDCLSRAEIAAAIRSLQRKGIILVNKPIRLTKLGKRIA